MLHSSVSIERWQPPPPLTPKEFKSGPISDLLFLTKLLEKVGASLLHSQLPENVLHEALRPGFSPAHSTETTSPVCKPAPESRRRPCSPPSPTTGDVFTLLMKTRKAVMFSVPQERVLRVFFCCYSVFAPLHSFFYYYYDNFSF